MQKVIVGVYALVVLLGEAIAMNDIQPPNPSSVGHIAREAPHFDAVTLRNFSLSEADTLNITNLYIEKYAYYLLSSVASLLKCSMMNNAVIVVAVLFDANVKHSEEFVEVSIGEGAYLAAISRIFSSEKPVVSEESLNDILFAAQHGNKDAELSIQLACNDSSYESAITKGEHRAKECLKNRILRTPYGLEFYRPIALDFSRIISSSFDWRKPFKHIAPNIMYLKSEGDIGYAYAAVQDVCYLYETLKEQYNAHLEDVDFRNNVAAFLLVASRVFANLHNSSLRSRFEELSSSVQSKDPNCIADAQGLFSEAAVVLETHDNSCSD